MRHVFVETNWIVAYGAPAYQRLPNAIELLERAGKGQVRLHLPSICLAEARQPIRTKFQPRALADAMRKYLAWARENRGLSAHEEEVVRRVLDRYEGQIVSELEGVEALLQSLPEERGLEVFPLSQHMLERAAALSLENLDLKPFDQAILAAVLVRAETLWSEDVHDLSFCELDADLQPWDRNGRAKEPLKSLYDKARVWVYGDFAMENPQRPDNWPA